jgi:AraC-like DNA-binding protein
MPGEFCLIQPGMPCVIEGRTRTVTPYAHLDLIYDPANTRTFPVSNLDLMGSAGLAAIQPPMRELLGVEVPVNIRPDDPIRFRDLLNRMIGAWRNGDMLSRLEANHIATELILSILKTYGSTSIPRNTYSPDSFSWITSYLWFHLSDPISVADMAERAGLSASRFSALFRHHLGCPPYRYLRRLRVSHARDLLTETDLILEAIAEQSGFANAQHFSKVFRQETGESPGTFRNRTRLHLG